MATDKAEYYTVAAVARQIGVAPATLRTWDRRYGLGPNRHSNGTHRRYAELDLARLILMRKLITTGVAPAEAAVKALALKVNQRSAKLVKPNYAKEIANPAALIETLVRAATALDCALVKEVLSKQIKNMASPQLGAN